MNAIKLPFLFDVEAIKADIQNLKESGYYLLDNTYLEPGSLVGFHLIEPEVEQGVPVFKPNQHLSQSPALLSLYESFKCDKETYRIHALRAGYTIKKHRDIARNFEHNMIRIHVPIISNDEIYTYLDDERVKMEPGECWYMDLDLHHEIFNKSDQDRVNLVMDCVRNKWWEGIFAECGKKHDDNPYRNMSVAELEGIKVNFQAMAPEVGKQLITEIDKELSART
jgi:hypothetical protein